MDLRLLEARFLLDGAREAEPNERDYPGRLKKKKSIVKRGKFSVNFPPGLTIFPGSVRARIVTGAAGTVTSSSLTSTTTASTLRLFFTMNRFR